MKASEQQIGGNHYKEFAIQPTEFIAKNNIGFIEGNVIKYVCRHKHKNGKEDIEKAIHYLQLLLEHQYPEKKEKCINYEDCGDDMQDWLLKNGYTL